VKEHQLQLNLAETELVIFSGITHWFNVTKNRRKGHRGMLWILLYVT